MYVDFDMADGSTVSLNTDKIVYLWKHPDEPNITKIGVAGPHEPNIEVEHRMSTVKRRINAAMES